MSMAPIYKTCDICMKSTGISEEFRTDYGDWLTKSGIQVHYFCLLLSHHLPQRGKDDAGLFGFLITDIRKEISEAAKRRCSFCNEKHASLRCAKCDIYFHLTCGDPRQCLWEFVDTFRTFCYECVPWTAEQLRRRDAGMRPDQRCYICKAAILKYHPARVIYASCCGNGYVHTVCMRRYALSAGYYLKCIWCAAPGFRDAVRRMGVYVPDREAQWERLQHGYSDLYQRHKRCDVEECLCPRGRNYSTSKWQFILCGSCGGFGAHNPICVTGNLRAKEKVKSFKCPTCQISSNSKCRKVLNVSSSTDLEEPMPHEGSRTCFSRSSSETIYSHVGGERQQPRIMRVISPTPSTHNACISPRSEAAESVVDLCTQASTSPAPGDECPDDDDDADQTELGSTSDLSAPASPAAEELPPEPPVDTINARLSAGEQDSMEIEELEEDIDEPLQEEWTAFNCLELDDAGQPLGIAVMRINLHSPRFKGQTLDEIKSKSLHLLGDDDISSQSNDLSHIKAIMDIIKDIAAMEAQESN